MPKKKNGNSGMTWTPKEIITLRELSERGSSNKEISEALGRSVSAISFQKAVRGIRKNKETNFINTKTSHTSVKVLEVLEKQKPLVKHPMKDPAKEITRIARQIARHNGKRITMAMFFVEDLD